MNKEYNIFERSAVLEMEIAEIQTEHDKWQEVLRNTPQCFYHDRITSRIEQLRETIRDKQFILNTIRMAA
ncbi:TPA: hypothetical protein ACGWHI_004259 [Salmonella enterica]|nr:hypothetical protein [Salmonella enterica subsp. enterica]